MSNFGFLLRVLLNKKCLNVIKLNFYGRSLYIREPTFDSVDGLGFLLCNDSLSTWLDSLSITWLDSLSITWLERLSITGFFIEGSKTFRVSFCELHLGFLLNRCRYSTLYWLKYFEAIMGTSFFMFRLISIMNHYDMITCSSLLLIEPFCV